MAKEVPRVGAYRVHNQRHAKFPNCILCFDRVRSIFLFSLLTTLLQPCRYSQNSSASTWLPTSYRAQQQCRHYKRGRALVLGIL